MLLAWLLWGCDRRDEALEARLRDDDGDGYTENGGDCDDADPANFPHNDERCDGRDEDCDGLVDEDPVDAALWYLDQDGDSYGAAAAEPVRACAAPAGMTAVVGGDCADEDEAISPGMAEVCGDGVDNDCDGGPGACTWAAEVILGEQRQIYYPDAPWGTGQGGTLADLDGDGSDDLVVGLPSSADGFGRISVFRLPLPQDPTDAVRDADLGISYGVADGGYGKDVESADIDGDGYDDLIAAHASDDTHYSTRACISYGPLEYEYSMPVPKDWVLTPDDGEEWEQAPGRDIHILGDIDGDGIDDLAVGDAQAEVDGEDGAGIMYIYTTAGSGEEEASASARAILRGEWDATTAEWIGHSMVPLDWEGDGTPEIAAGAPEGYYDDGRVHLFSAEALWGTVTQTHAEWTWEGEDKSHAGMALDAGDLDGDGYPDLLIGAPDDARGGAAFLVWGGSPPRDSYLADAPVVFRGDAAVTNRLGHRLRVADVDLDGQADVLIADGEGQPADLYLHLGPFPEDQVLSREDADIRLRGDSRWPQTYGMLEVADTTGSGAVDVVVGAPDGLDGMGVVFLARVYPW